MGNETILRRICGKMPEDADVLRFLIELPPSDLQSLLMETYARRAARLAPGDVLKAYRSGRFTALSHADPARICEIDAAAYALLKPAFTAVEPSPLSPFGCASALGPVSQNSIVTASRNTEVCSDITNVLALECAVRRKELLHKDAHSPECVKLCASQRQVRSQPFTGPNMFAHFRVFAMCTAGHDEGNFRFEQAALAEHISFYVKLLHTLGEKGCRIKDIRIALVLYDSACKALLTGVQAVLREAIGLSAGIVENFNKPYYCQAGYQVYATNSRDEELFLADGGFTDWTQILLGNRKERLLTGGIGTERLAVCFDW